MRSHLLGLLQVLASAKQPLSAATLIAKAKINHSSVHLHLKKLCEVGIVERQGSTKPYRYRLVASGALSQLSQQQIAALLLAQQAAAPLRGSRLAHELDKLVASLTEHQGVQSLVMLVPPSTLIDGRVFDTVQEAQLQRRQLRVFYQGDRDPEPRWRSVEPLHFYLKGDQPYLEVHDLDSEATRTLKLARMSLAEMLALPCRHPASPASHDLKPHAHKVWDAPLVEVTVRLAPSKARYAREWPLKRTGQQELPQPDGSLLVKASVAGTAEALKWVLGWGAGARVESPPSLREEHLRELRAALASYS